MDCIVNKFDMGYREFRDFRDWFITEDEKIKEVHNVDTDIYLNDILMFSKKVPISVNKIDLDFTINNLSKPFTIYDISIFIKEMNFYKKRSFSPKTINIEETATLNWTIKFDDGE